ncbi:MAG: ADP-ribosylglycohydrolase family protein [Candidatus Thorarchaeota archaeon]
MVDLKDRYEGCMLGLAIGDAVGAATESMMYDDIRRSYPPNGVSGFLPFRGLRAGSYTDDTEMSIAVAQGLLNSKDFTSSSTMDSISLEFIKWKQQTSSSRSPGNTCMGSVSNLESGIHWSESGKNDSKGCGTAMRSAPIGLAYWHAIDALTVFATKSSLITHGHLAATAGSVGTAFLVAKSLDDTPILKSLDLLMKHTKRISLEFVTAISLVSEALEMKDNKEAHALLGAGWVAEEAVAGAVFAVAKHPDSFGNIILEAANSGGDTDSKACIAGAIAGSLLGRESIPSGWIEGIENRKLLLDLSRRLMRLQTKLADI